MGEGETATFTVSVQTQTNGDPIREATIDFGDGDRRSLGPVSGSRSIQKAYARKGSYSVVVTVTDTGGEVTTAATAVTVEERVINVTLTASPTNPTSTTTVVFTATLSGTGAGINVVSYNWNLGDNDRRVTTGPQTSKVYGSPGRRRVTLEVVNAVGQRGEAIIEVNVQ